MSTDELHVVLGAGQIGTLVVERLLARGLRVRQVRRKPVASSHPRVESRSGDLSDPDFARAAMAGASVVYHCVNALYDQWHTRLLPLTRGVIAGATAAGARLIVLDNLYMYGRPAGGVLREDTRVAPCSKKGVLRARQGEELLAAHARGVLRVAIARAADFVGPEVHNSVFGERYWQRALFGRRVEIFGDIDLPRSYAYSPDVADGLVTLGAQAGGDGQIWHLPAVPGAPTTRALIERLAAELGTPARTRYLPTFVLRAFGLFQPLVREVAEMTYQWQVPYVVDDTRFCTHFGVRATPLDEVARATVAWARAAWARPAPASLASATSRP